MSDQPLFERLGGRDGIHALSTLIVDNHLANPIVSTRFRHAHMTRDELIEGATEFFCTGLSGVETYTGQPLPEAHAGMNIAGDEFLAVLDDVLAAMATRELGEREQAEVLQILYGMKPDVVGL